MNRIKKLRIKNNLSQKNLAKKIGLSHQSISYYESGKRHPKIESWQKLADFFGVSVDYLRGSKPKLNLYQFYQYQDEYGMYTEFTVLAEDEDDAWRQILNKKVKMEKQDPFVRYEILENRKFYHVEKYPVNEKSVIPHYSHD